MGLFGNPSAPRRELKRKDFALRGVVGLAVVALVLAFTYFRSTGAFSDAEVVNTTLRNVGGSLGSGSDVKIKGVIVGKVKSIAESEGRVKVEVTMEPGAIDNIPADVNARVLPATVFGTSFIDLRSPAAVPARLKDGATIPEDTSTETIELQRALDDIDKLVKALGPAELASAIGSAAQACDGRGAQIGASIDRANGYIGRLNASFPLFREDLGLLAKNLDIVNRAAPDLLAGVDGLLVTANTIVERSSQLTALLAGGLNLVQDADVFLAANTERFVRSIQLASVVTDAVYDNRRAGLHDSFYANVKLAKRALGATFHGAQGWGYLDIKVEAAPYYTAADCPTYQGGYGCGRTRSAQRMMAGSLMDGGAAR